MNSICLLFVPLTKKGFAWTKFVRFFFLFFQMNCDPACKCGRSISPIERNKTKLRNRIKKEGEEEAIGYWNKM